MTLLDANERELAADGELTLDVDDDLAARSRGRRQAELLRILSEALTNARRHARAQHIVVRVTRPQDRGYRRRTRSAGGSCSNRGRRAGSASECSAVSPSGVCSSAPIPGYGSSAAGAAASACP